MIVFRIKDIGSIMVKKYIVDNSMKIIKSCYPNYSKEDLEKIQYGLESIYLSLTKVLAIIILSIVLKIFKETIIILLLFNLLRMTAFGIHASKSWVCWITSVPTFIIIPLVCKHIILPMHILIILSIFSIINFILFAPADTVKRPLIRKKRRIMYKISTIILGLIYLTIIIFAKNPFLQNALALSMLIETILICPLTYKIFKMPYNNYKTYKKRV